MLSHTNLLWDAPRTWVCVLLSLVFLIMGARACLAPLGFSRFFGIAVSEGDAVYVRVAGARDIAMSAMGAAFILMDLRIPFAILIFASAIVAALDGFIGWVNGGPGVGAKHVFGAVLLSVLGFWTLH